MLYNGDPPQFPDQLLLLQTFALGRAPTHPKILVGPGLDLLSNVESFNFKDDFYAPEVMIRRN